MMEKSVNRAMELPVISDDLPKELDDQELAEGDLLKILITPERATIIKEFVAQLLRPNSQLTSRRKGWILSGPNGQGKSVMSYLLACTAYANGCLLTYIVRCHVIHWFPLSVNCMT